MAVQSSGHIPCLLCGYFHSEYLTCESARVTGRRIQPPRGATMPGVGGYAAQGEPVITQPPDPFRYSSMCRDCQNRHPSTLTCAEAFEYANNRRAEWYAAQRDAAQDRSLSLWLTDDVRLASRRHDSAARLEVRLSHPA